MMSRLAERDLQTVAGTFHEILFNFNDVEAIALVMGDVSGRDDVLCRIHSSCISAHAFNSIECTCREEMLAAQRVIAENGTGVIIYLEQEGKGNGHRALIESIPFKRAGHTQSEAYELAGYQDDARDYTPAAEILRDVNVRSVVLVSGGRSKADELTRLGVNINAVRALDLAAPER